MLVINTEKKIADKKDLAIRSYKTFALIPLKVFSLSLCKTGVRKQMWKRTK